MYVSLVILLVLLQHVATISIGSIVHNFNRLSSLI